jgi:hypothetical protein
MNWFYLSLKYFTQEQREYLVSILTSITNTYNQCPDEEQNMIMYLFSKLSGYTVEERNTVYDFVLRRLLFNCFALLYEVNKGESFNVAITKDDNDDWTPYIITIRDDDTGLLLSSGIDNATNAGVQYILLDNYSLPSGKFHKLRISLELSTDGVANGDVFTTIGHIYLLTSKDVDVNG